MDDFHQPLINKKGWEMPETKIRTALAAAEKRVCLGSSLPSGPIRLGGDSSVMAALSPIQAAAMAAERRLQDNICCGSESDDASEEREEENNDQKPLETVDSVGSSRNYGAFGAPAVQVLSQKRKHWSSETLSSQPHNSPFEAMFVDLTMGASLLKSTLYQDEVPTKRIRQSGRFLILQSLNSVTPRSVFTNNGSCSTEESPMWECGTCTLLNPSLAPVCEVYSVLENPMIFSENIRFGHANFVG